MTVAPPSTQRLTRLLRWGRLWLMWFAGAIAPHIDRAWLTETLTSARSWAMCMLIALAARRATPPRKGRAQRLSAPHGHRLRIRRPRRSAIVGAAVRRKLRGMCPADRLGALLAALLDPEALIAAVAKRLGAGLRATVSFLLRAPFEPALRPAAPLAPRSPDSS